jgi:hypothetical protein
MRDPLTRYNQYGQPVSRKQVFGTVKEAAAHLREKRSKRGNSRDMTEFVNKRQTFRGNEGNDMRFPPSMNKKAGVRVEQAAGAGRHTNPLAGVRSAKRKRTYGGV